MDEEYGVERFAALRFREEVGVSTAVEIGGLSLDS